MTFREKQQAFLDDLLAERAATTETCWGMRLDDKIVELRAAMEIKPHNDGPEHYCQECKPNV